MRGIIELPLEAGRKELAWYAGRAVVNGTTQTSTVVPLKVERDADFVAKRLYLVQWPNFAISTLADLSLSLPPQSSVTLRDGTTKRGLSLVAQAAGNIPDANPARMSSNFLGLSAPYLIRANNSIFAEVVNPGAAGTPWVGDLFLVAEGFKIYPHVPEEFPSTIKEYAIPYALNVNSSVLSPAAGAQYVAGQFAVITNNGEGKFLAKGMRVTIIDNAGVDKTSVLAPLMAFAISDTTSGNKRWNQDTSQDATYPLIPVPLMTLGGSFLPFNTPRYIDPNGVVQVQIIWPSVAAAQVYIAAAASFPLSVSIELDGALLPR